MMNCIRCDCEAGYNRAVVDTVSGEERGRFCRNCELEEFGRTLERLCQTDRSCVFCNRDGHFGFAAWTSTLQDGGERQVSSVEYEVTDRTPFLCDEHFHVVTGAEPETSAQRGRVSR